MSAGDCSVRSPGDWTGLEGKLADTFNTIGAANARLATELERVAVTKGDLTQSIQVDARGEVAELKDNINTMIGNPRLATDRNNEQDWPNTNRARFTNMLQGEPRCS